MTNQEATNLINNKASDLQTQYSAIATNQATNLQQSNLASYENLANIQKDVCTSQITSLSSTYSGEMTPEATNKLNEIVKSSTESLSGSKDEYTKSYSSMIDNSFNFILLDYQTSLGIFVKNIPNNPLSSPAITSLTNAAVNNIGGTLSILKSSLVNSFTKNITNIFKSNVAYINSLVGKFPNLANQISKDAEKIKTTFFNFFKRPKGTSSTSLYIQSNIPNSKGELQSKSGILDSTPDGKILNPKLKSESNTVIEMITNPLATALGFITSLIPNKKITKIEEPKLTSDKNVYGQTQVHEDKGGNTIITTTTPGNVTRTVIHPSGSNDRVLDDGSKINKTVANKTDITDGDWEVITSKDKVEIIVGNEKIEIRKNYSQNINGNVNKKIDGYENKTVVKDVYHDFKSNKTEKITHNSEEDINGNKITKILGFEKRTTGNSNTTIKGALSIVATGNITFSCGGKMIAAGSDGLTSTMLHAGNGISGNVSNIIFVDGIAVGTY